MIDYLKILFILSSLVIINKVSSKELNLISNDKSIDYFLSLDKEQFDQNLNNGWRILSNDGCYKEAAKLIEIYLLFSRGESYLYGDEFRSLRWHAGQNLVMNDNITRALKFFRASYNNDEDYYSKNWNFYVDGTIAFLERDKTKLISAKNNLAKSITEAKNEKHKLDYYIPLSKDSNYLILNNLIKYFDKSYATAYSGGQKSNMIIDNEKCQLYSDSLF